MLVEVKAVRHCIRDAVPLVQRRQIECLLAEAHQTYMRIELMRKVSSLCIGAQRETADARSVTKRVSIEFRKSISRALGMLALPPLNHFGLNVVIPAAPIIPRDEDHCLG